MTEPFIFISTSAVREGKLEAYRQRFADVVEIAEAKEPRLLHFALYLSDDGTEETVVQVHSEPASMSLHMELVADHVRAAAEFLDFSRMSIQVYGTPDDAILEQVRQLAGSGVRVSVKRHADGFNRLPDL